MFPCLCDLGAAHRRRHHRFAGACCASPKHASPLLGYLGLSKLLSELLFQALGLSERCHARHPPECAATCMRQKQKSAYAEPPHTPNFPHHQAPPNHGFGQPTEGYWKGPTLGRPFRDRSRQYLATTGALPTGALPYMVQPAALKRASTAAVAIRHFFIGSPQVNQQADDKGARCRPLVHYYNTRLTK